MKYIIAIIIVASIGFMGFKKYQAQEETIKNITAEKSKFKKDLQSAKDTIKERDKEIQKQRQEIWELQRKVQTKNEASKKERTTKGNPATQIKDEENKEAKSSFPKYFHEMQKHNKYNSQ